MYQSVCIKKYLSVYKSVYIFLLLFFLSVFFCFYHIILFCTVSILSSEEYAPVRSRAIRRLIFYLASWFRTCHFSEPIFQPAGAIKSQKYIILADFPIFSRTCIFFFLSLSFLSASSLCFLFIYSYYRKLNSYFFFEIIFV